MADKAGISEGLWRQIESGKRPLRNGQYETVNPKPDTVAKVCRVLRWPADAFDRLAAGEDVESLIPVPQMNEEDAVVLINDRLSEWYVEYGPAGIPDHFLDDDDWLADVRDRSLELFGIFLLERHQRRMARRLDEVSALLGSDATPAQGMPPLNDTQMLLTRKVLEALHDLTDRLTRVEDAVRSQQSRPTSGV